MSPTFRALAHPDYRIWAGGALVSNAGTWMQRVAQDWLVLTVLTDESATAVGITTALQFAPMALLAPVGGVVADRFDRRRVLMATQSAAGLLALVLGLLVVTGTAQLWHVYTLAGLLGVASALDAPTRHAFVGGLVPEADLANAVSLNSASFHAGRLIGPGLAGWLIHWFGTGPVFLVNAVSFGAVLVSLTRIGPVADADGVAARPDPGRGGLGALREGLAYVRGRGDLVLVLSLVGVVGTFGLNFQMTTALMARLVYDRGAREYGMLGSVLAVGALAGALLAARRDRPTPRLVVLATLGFGAAATAAALMPGYLSFAAALVPVGLASITLMTTANSTVQLATEPAMRGRVMALYIAVFMGGTPIGAPLIGWVGEHLGARWTIGFGGAVSLIAGLVAWVLLPRVVVNDSSCSNPYAGERARRRDDRAPGNPDPGPTAHAGRDGDGGGAAGRPGTGRLPAGHAGGDERCPDRARV